MHDVYMCDNLQVCSSTDNWELEDVSGEFAKSPMTHPFHSFIDVRMIYVIPGACSQSTRPLHSILFLDLHSRQYEHPQGRV